MPPIKPRNAVELARMHRRIYEKIMGLQRRMTGKFGQIDKTSPDYVSNKTKLELLQLERQEIIEGIRRINAKK